MSVVVKGQSARVESKDNGRDFDIWAVNGVRLGKIAINRLETEARNHSLDIDEYIQHHPEYIMSIRNEEEAHQIVHEENDIVVIRHGNEKEVAREGGKAFIVSPIDQSKLSVDFLLNASGDELKNFFNAAAQAVEKEGLDINKVFAVLHFRGQKAPYTVSPQEYEHIHLTDFQNLNPKIKRTRSHVPHPRLFDMERHERIANLSRFTSEGNRFEVIRLNRFFNESKLHSIVAGEKSIIQLLRNGTAEEWSAWRDAITADEELINEAKTNGLRMVFEHGVAHMHAGEALYQTEKPHRWSAAQTLLTP